MTWTNAKKARRASRIAAVLLLTIAASEAARAAQGRWTPFGPGEGELASFAASSRGDLYVTTSFAGLTEIWKRPAGAVAFGWRGAGLGLPQVTAVALHPRDPLRLWAVSGSGLQTVYRSIDAGGTWQAVVTGDADFRVAHLWVVPTRTTVSLLAETGGGASRRLLRSADGGATWSAVPGAIGPVAAAPDEPGVVYAATTAGGRVLRSTDGGATFHATAATAVPAGDVLVALHATSKKGALVFASFATGGLLRSTDRGGHWQRVQLPGNQLAVGLTSDPTNPATVIATSGGAFYSSSRGGRPGSWRHLFSTFFSPAEHHSASELAVIGREIYFRAGPDIYIYRQFVGKVDEKGIEASATRELHIHPIDPTLVGVVMEVVELGCVGSGCRRTLLSVDGGALFGRLGGQYLPHSWLDVRDLAFDPAHPPERLESLGGFLTLRPEGLLLPPTGVSTVEYGAGGSLLAGGLSGVQVSTDGGSSWSTTLPGELPATPEHPAGGSREALDLAANPFARDRVWTRALESATGGIGGDATEVLYRSTDNGSTWSRGFGGIDDPLDVEPIPGTAASAYLLAVTATGTELRRSHDDGATSQLVHTFVATDAVLDLAIDPADPHTLYAATAAGVRRSRDAGVSWEPTPGGFAPWGNYRRWVTRVWVHPTERGHLFAAPAFGGLFENQLPE